MFCCWRSKCLEYSGTKQQEKDMKSTNHGIYDQRNSLLSTDYKDKLTSNTLKHVSNSHESLRIRDNINVTGIQAEVRKPSTGHTCSYKQDGYWAIHIPKLESNPARELPTNQNSPPSNPVRPSPTRGNDPRSDPVRRASARENVIPPDSVRQASARKKVHQSYPVRQASTLYFGMTDDDIETHSEAIDIFSNLDAASLTDKQRLPLEQVNNAVNAYHSDDESPTTVDTSNILPYRPVHKSGDDDGDETPMIVVDILPYGQIPLSDDVNESRMSVAHILPAGQFEELKSTLESYEDEPLTRYLRLKNKSMNSQNGIIPEKRSSSKGRNSVSFRLPVDHVDKPYSPMKTRTWSKAKRTPIQITQPVPNKPSQTMCISGNDVNIWHTGNTVYGEDKYQPPMCGTIRRSFKLPVYGVYGLNDISKYNAYTTHLGPNLIDQDNSFRNTIYDNAVLKSRENSAIFRHKMVR